MTSKQRIGLYFSWNRPEEIGGERGLWTLNNRYPSLFEFRRAVWPHYEHFSDASRYRQDVSGFLDHVVLFDFRAFGTLIKEVTGHEVPVIQRFDDSPPTKELDDELLANIDTLIVVSLDHFRTNQRATRGEIEAVTAFLHREGKTLIVSPHHDVGSSSQNSEQVTELQHHGDRLVPAQQEIGGFARSLLAGLGFPVENRFGLNPARVGNDPAPLRIAEGAEERGLLEGVSTFNLHPHLPHLHVPASIADEVLVLAEQAINPSASTHPFVEQGNRYFNALLQIPAKGDRAGDIFVCDATLWSGAFGGLASLKRFWCNIAGVDAR